MKSSHLAKKKELMVVGGKIMASGVKVLKWIEQNNS
jgi:hypothetical protein